MQNRRIRMMFYLCSVIAIFELISLDAFSKGAAHTVLRESISVLVFAVQMVLLIWTIYQSVISVAGLFKTKKLSKSVAKPPRFLCITAAHNEAAVIAQHVKNLKNIKYPKDCYSVVVLADNCTDDTAKIARRLGATVWERTSPIRGKGHALQWALHTRANLRKYDAVCIFDADNLVAPNFLEVMASHINHGDSVIQAYLDTKNPWDSWITASYASAYWFMNRFWQRARRNLGLSGALGGTGFCLSTGILRRFPWEATSLTEDLEYTMKVNLEHEKVVWTGETRVYDEKPVNFATSVPQRERWMQGHWFTAINYSYSILKSTFKCKSIKQAVQSIDMLMYLWQPGLMLLMGLNFLFMIGQWCYGTMWYVPWLTIGVPAYLWTVTGTVAFVSPLIAFMLERAGWRSLLYFPFYLLFNLTWIPISMDGLLRYNNRDWVHTKHHRSLALEQISKEWRG